MRLQSQPMSEVTIRFAGDSGDGMQLTGSQFTNTTALMGNDLSTFPDFPAEIRAPAGTVAGVSAFQIHFGSNPIFTPGDEADVLVAMNAAALKANLTNLKNGGLIIANTAGFDKKNLSLAKYDVNPLEDNSLAGHQVIKFDVSKLTSESLKESGLTPKDIDRAKNMFVLGVLYWLYSRPLEPSVQFIEKKFGKKAPEIAAANIKVLNDGYTFGEATEIFTSRFEVKQASIEAGTYRNITGNEATVLGLVAAAEKSGIPLFYGSYPITPASDILHGLAKHKQFNVRTFQAEDEIAAIATTIGAAFGGSLAVTGSSGPGIALKGEAIGLAIMLELPLVVVNVQRGGPSTGLPTKTEQSDLMQAVYGRNGEAPMVVVAAKSPADCFDTAYEACRIALEHMIPVMFLSDGYLGNGSEPWLFPKEADLQSITAKYEPSREEDAEPFKPYRRDAKLARPWAIPGTKGLEHRIGGIEKQNETGNISYDPANHEFMVKLRAEKRDRVADYIPMQDIDNGKDHGKLLFLTWGSTYGSVKTAVHEARLEGYDVSHAHLRYLSPFPKNLEYILKGFDKVVIPELNNGQLVKMIRDQFLIPAEGFNKIKGMPFTVSEVKQKIYELLNK
ncbi:2-oxoacid:acceptor oxidoreductase subunit alpha [bacterium]|nr:MAG: 2-oxoacid:acceptor oxidoreductase subunit alpha [bacterium]